MSAGDAFDKLCEARDLDKLTRASAVEKTAPVSTAPLGSGLPQGIRGRYLAARAEAEAAKHSGDRGRIARADEDCEKVAIECKRLELALGVDELFQRALATPQMTGIGLRR
jgi:hypothetical protein